MHVFTIGHSNKPVDRLLDRLRTHGIKTLIDVRSRPFSRYCPQFNRDNLADSIPSTGAEYHFLGEFLGGKPGREYLNDEGGPDYEKMAKRPHFAHGLWLCRQAIHGGPVALMCSEGHPAKCHRHLLIAPALKAIGVDAVHILMDSSLIGADMLSQMTAAPSQIGMDL